MAALHSIGLLLATYLDLITASGTEGIFPDFTLQGICGKQLEAGLREQVIVQRFSPVNMTTKPLKCILKIRSDEGVLVYFRDLAFLNRNAGCENHHNNFIIVDLEDPPFKEDRCSPNDFASPYLYRSRGYLRLTVAVDLTATHSRPDAGDVAMDFRFTRTAVVGLCGQCLGKINSRTLLSTTGFPHVTTEINNCSSPLNVGSNRRLIITVLDVVLSSPLSDDCACFVDFTSSKLRLCLNGTTAKSSFAEDISLDINIPEAPTGGLSCAILLLVEVADHAIMPILAIDELLMNTASIRATQPNSASTGSWFLSQTGVLKWDTGVFSLFHISLTVGLSLMIAIATAMVIKRRCWTRREAQYPRPIDCEPGKCTNSQAQSALGIGHRTSAGSISIDSEDDTILSTGSSFIERPQSGDSACNNLSHLNAGSILVLQSQASESGYAHLEWHRSREPQYTELMKYSLAAER